MNLQIQLCLVVSAALQSKAHQTTRLNYTTTFLHIRPSFVTSISSAEFLLPQEKKLLLKYLPNNTSTLRVPVCFPVFQKCKGSTRLRSWDDSFSTLGYWHLPVNGTCISYSISYRQESECACVDESIRWNGTLLYDKLQSNEGLSWNISKQQTTMEPGECGVPKFIPSENVQENLDYYHVLELPLNNADVNFLYLKLCTTNECKGGTVTHMDTFYDEIKVKINVGKPIDVLLTVPRHHCVCSAYSPHYKDLSLSLDDMVINVSACGIFNISSVYNINHILRNLIQKCEAATSHKTEDRGIMTTERQEQDVMGVFQDPSVQAATATEHTAHNILLVVTVALNIHLINCY
ncbi:uncharacterized protein LOC121864486 [Homarus americanus]|nr:uncharacterized protein LOC121864486 [Homarus americanus]